MEQENTGDGQRRLLPITTNVDEELYRKVETDAKAQDRTMSNLVRVILTRFYND